MAIPTYYQVIITDHNNGGEDTEVYLIDEKNVDDKMLARMIKELYDYPFWCSRGVAELYEDNDLEPSVCDLHYNRSDIGEYLVCDGHKHDEPFTISRTFMYYR